MGKLYDLPTAVKRIKAARNAIDALGEDVILVALWCFITPSTPRPSVQALEVYHARSGHFESFQLPPADHKKKVEEVLKSMPAEHAEWVRRKIISANCARRYVVERG